MLHFVCGSCGAAVAAPEDCQGRTTTCRYCRQPITVPIAGALVSAPAPKRNQKAVREARWGLIAACGGVCVLLGVGVVLYSSFSARHGQDTTLAKVESRKTEPEVMPSENMPVQANQKPESTKEDLAQESKKPEPDAPSTSPAPARTEPLPASQSPQPSQQPKIKHSRPKIEPKAEVTIQEIAPRKHRPAPIPPTTAAPVSDKVADTEVAGKTLPQWIKEITSRDRSRAEKALHMILRFGPELALQAVPVLIKGFKEHETGLVADANSRSEATSTLGTILGAAPRPDPNLLSDAVAVLSKLLQDRQAVVRFRAAEALGKIGPPANSAVPRLVALTHERQSWETRQAAVSALATIAWDRSGKTPPAAEAVSALKTALGDSAAAVRLAAAKALAVLGSAARAEQKSEILAALQAHARNTKEEPAVRVWAHMASMYVANEVTDDQLTAVAAFLDHPDMSARLQAAKALGFVGPKAGSAVPQLLANLNATDAEVVLSSIEGLAGICKEPTPALPVLQDMARDMDRPAAVRQAARHAVDIITGKPAAK